MDYKSKIRRLAKLSKEAQKLEVELVRFFESQGIDTEDSNDDGGEFCERFTDFVTFDGGGPEWFINFITEKLQNTKS